MKQVLASIIILMNFINVSYGADNYYLYQLTNDLKVIHMASFDSESANNYAHCSIHKQVLETEIVGSRLPFYSGSSSIYPNCGVFKGSTFICSTEKTIKF